MRMNHILNSETREKCIFFVVFYNCTFICINQTTIFKIQPFGYNHHRCSNDAYVMKGQTDYISTANHRKDNNLILIDINRDDYLILTE